MAATEQKAAPQAGGGARIDWGWLFKPTEHSLTTSEPDIQLVRLGILQLQACFIPFCSLPHLQVCVLLPTTEGRDGADSVGKQGPLVLGLISKIRTADRILSDPS